MTKTPKRPRDPSQLAKFVVDVAMGEVEDRQRLRSNKAKGGEIGGPARAKSLSADRRSEIAGKAALARWKKTPK
jgi:hypothetical protein